jgi:dCTP deaminase
MASTSRSEAPKAASPATSEPPLGLGPGHVLPSQGLRKAVEDGWITAGRYAIPTEAIQPASLDLHLGPMAWRLQCSFLPDAGSSVSSKARDLTFDEIDLGRGGAVLEPNRPYLIPLVEELHLPPGIRAKANPKSSTGRLDVFTRVITDRNHRFDEIRDGYSGKLYLEVVSRSFAIRVEEGLALNQLRMFTGDARLSDEDLRSVHGEFPLLYMDSHPLPEKELSISNGLFMSVDLAASSGPLKQVVGYKAKDNSRPIDLASRGNEWMEYWDPVHPDRGSSIVLQPEVFYLLLSAEGVCIPPEYAAEMTAYDPTAGELRTHYAGFFDPGFGFDPEGTRHGSRAALEVRARDVPFMVEHRQPICKLAFERLTTAPDVVYGEELGSSYQGQETMLSKHFKEQTAGVTQMRLPGNSESVD